MKLTLIAMIALLATTAQAKKVEKETIVCLGIKKSQGYRLQLSAKSQSNVEDKAIAYWATLEQDDGVGYEGLIFGYKEDVMLQLKPRANDNVQVSGTIFMDESEQSLDYESADGEVIKLRLDCQVQ